MHSYAEKHDEEKSWYVKYQSNSQPLLPEDDHFQKKYDVLSLDKSGNKTVYLTFDAGYENGNIEKIMDTMKRHNVTGSFFILPNLIRSNTDLVKRMSSEGHLICNHTYSHKNMAQVRDIDDFKNELDMNSNLLKSTTGIEMARFYRPPEGRYSEQNLKFAKELGYKTVFWSFAYADWDNNKQMSPSHALEFISSRIHDGCILLLHPTSQTNAQIMDDLIQMLKDKGYTFKSLEEYPIESTSMENKCGKISDYVYEDGECNIFTNNRSAKKKVALSFDDGPSRSYTNAILEILKKYNAKGTFFVIGQNALKNPDLIHKEFSDGHEIGNHTLTHPDMKKLSNEDIKREIVETQNIIKSITGTPPKLFRPPGGYVNNTIISIAGENNIKTVLWSWRQDTKDWTKRDAKLIANNVITNIADGDIILFHDFNTANSPTPEALEIILEQLCSLGYDFVTVSELIDKL